VLSSPSAAPLLASYSRHALADAVRVVIDEARSALRTKDGHSGEAYETEALVTAAARLLSGLDKRRPCSVVNATGVILHTNLGRARLAASAIDAVGAVAADPCALEYELDAGERGDRDELVEGHITDLTGAEAATVVNNNAAAVLLALNSLAEGREVVVSRGELVEIGGSFRIPELMAKSGAILREVGTTNRTHRRDYEGAIGARTAMLLKVHPSNYRIVGYATDVELADLRKIADQHGCVSVVEDLGAGALVDLSQWGLPAEPVVRDRLKAGADIVTFSGDKLLGGPQCGIAVGSAAAIAKLRRNPLRRALRCDKMTLAALDATLRLYRFHPSPEREIPCFVALLKTLDALEAVGRQAVRLLESKLGAQYTIEVQPSKVQIGSGAQPDVLIDSVAVAIHSRQHPPQAIAHLFRSASPPVIGRIENDRFLLDLRGVDRAEQLVPN
jgi:L-seryl-tRNA(Ser) seleniumtransferase